MNTAIELCCGAADITAALRLHGWAAFGIDIDPKRRNADILADIRSLPLRGHFRFMWCSPPCTEFSPWGMPNSWHPYKKTPSMDLLEACIEATKMADAWIIENVRGAIQWFKPYLGAPQTHAGPWYLWSNLPIDCSRMDRHIVQKFTGPGPNSKRSVRSLAPMAPTLVDAISRALTLLLP